MVFIPPNTNIPRLNAYILKPLSPEQLETFKRSFEIGTCAPFAPKLELVLQHAPGDYLNQPHSHIRTREDEAGRRDPFVLIDEQAHLAGAVWYVDRFASQEEVDDNGAAASTLVLWEILVRTECLALTWVNYAIANTTIQEDLEGNCGVDLPAAEGFAQREVYSVGGMDMRKERYRQDAWVTAEPGEFEESADEGLRGSWVPRPDRVARLREGLADEAGLVNRWTIPSPARPRRLPDGSLKEFPEGSVVLQLRYNPDFPWPEYTWPDGSLQ